MERGTLGYLIDHVFLPPKLPQEDDECPKNSEALINVCLTTLSEFTHCLPAEERGEWEPLLEMLQYMLAVRDEHGNLVRENLVDIVDGMNSGGMANYYCSELSVC